MYEEFYNLREKPFAIEPNPRYIVLGDDQREALATLIYAVEQREGWALLLGAPGTGKTTLIIALLRQLGDKVITGVLTNPTLEPLDFFNMVSLELGLEGPFSSKGRFLVALSQLIKRCRLEGKSLLLVIDEAQSLPEEMFDELRLLGNLDDGSPRVLNIFLVGQPEMAKSLRLARSRGLMQRLRRYHLVKTMDLDTTRAYIKHRLKVAGAEREIFDEPAIQSIWRLSQGNCRLVNAICDDSLLLGFTEEQPTIGQALVLKAAAENPALDAGLEQALEMGQDRPASSPPAQGADQPSPEPREPAPPPVAPSPVAPPPAPEPAHPAGSAPGGIEQTPDQVMDLVPPAGEMVDAALPRRGLRRRSRPPQDKKERETPRRKPPVREPLAAPKQPGAASRFATSLSKETKGSFWRRLIIVLILGLVIGGSYLFFSSSGNKLARKVWHLISGRGATELYIPQDGVRKAAKKPTSEQLGIKDWGPIVRAPMDRRAGGGDA